MVRTGFSAHAGDMTTTPPEAPSGGASPGTSPGSSPPLDDGGPRVSRDEVRELSRLRRSRDDRKIAGVAGGIARHLDIDPVIVRIGLVVLAVFGGAGLLVYGALWLLLPEDGSDRAVLSLDDRSRTVAVLGIGVLAALSLVGGPWGFWDFPWPLVLIGVAVVLLLSRRESASGPGPASGGPGPGPAPDGSGSARVSLAKQPALPGSTDPWQPTLGWQGYPPPAAPRPRDLRKRGPILFGFTLALAVLAVGLVGVVDVAAEGVPNAAYPAAVVAVCGVMLLVGAFFGRAGGLIALGLLGTVALTGAAASDYWDGGREVERPLSAAQVQEDYWLPAGELVLDLSAVSDPESLTGDAIDVEVGLGRVEVILPDGVNVDISAEVTGAGEIRLPNETVDGVELLEQDRVRPPGATGESALLVNISAGVGQIEVLQ